MGGFLGPTAGQSLLAALRLAGLTAVPSFEFAQKSNVFLAGMALSGGAAMAWASMALRAYQYCGWSSRTGSTLDTSGGDCDIMRWIICCLPGICDPATNPVSSKHAVGDGTGIPRTIVSSSSMMSEAPAEYAWTSANFPLKKRSDGRFEMQTEMRARGPYGTGILRGTYTRFNLSEAQSLRWDFQGLSIPLEKTGRWADTPGPRYG